MDIVLGVLSTTHPIFLSSLSFLSGVLIGHWIALGRDKRREFNAIVEPIRRRLVIDLESPPGRMPNAVELDRLDPYLWPWQRRRLRDAIERHTQCYRERQRVDGYGDVSYRDPEAITTLIAVVLRQLQPR